MKIVMTVFFFMLFFWDVFSQNGSETKKEKGVSDSNKIIKTSDHLEPERGVLSSPEFELKYYQEVKSILLDTLGNRPIIGMLILPSFSSEYFIRIDKIENKYLLTEINLDQSIWYNHKSKKINRILFTKSISDEVVIAFSSLFEKFLLDTRYSTSSIWEADGVYYHFFSSSSKGYFEGVKRSPTKGSKIDQLVKLTEMLLMDYDDDKLLGEIAKLKAKI